MRAPMWPASTEAFAICLSGLFPNARVTACDRVKVVPCCAAAVSACKASIPHKSPTRICWMGRINLQSLRPCLSDRKAQSLEERHRIGKCYRSTKLFLQGWDRQHPQVFLCENSTQPRQKVGFASQFKISAAVDGMTQIGDKCDAGRASLDMSTHLLTLGWTQTVIQVLRKVGKDFLTLRRTVLRSLATLRLSRLSRSLRRSYPHHHFRHRFPDV